MIELFAFGLMAYPAIGLFIGMVGLMVDSHNGQSHETSIHEKTHFMIHCFFSWPIVVANEIKLYMDGR